MFLPVYVAISIQIFIEFIEQQSLDQSYIEVGRVSGSVNHNASGP